MEILKSGKLAFNPTERSKADGATHISRLQGCTSEGEVFSNVASQDSGGWR